MALLVLFFLSSCYAELNLDKYRPDPKIVLNSAILADSVVMASISRTWFMSENNPDVNIDDAIVSLYVNGAFREQMRWEWINNKNGMYCSCYYPIAGDVIKITAATELGTVWAEDTVPLSKIPVEDITISRRFVGSNSSSTVIDPSGTHVTEQSTHIEITYKITFQDIPEQKDLYFIHIDDYQSSRGSVGGIYYDSEPVFINEDSSLEGALGKTVTRPGRTFTDDLFDGQKYTLTIKEKGPTSDYARGAVLKRKISLYILSEAYYRYLTSIQNTHEERFSQDLVELGLAEPFPIFSNVNGGTGILGAAQKDFKIVDLRTIIDEKGNL